MSQGAKQTLVLVAVLAGALIVRMWAWFAFRNSIWPDEIFQSMEQAHRVVFGYGVVPWEFRDATRSWLLPGTLAGIMWASAAVTSSTWAYLTACASFLSTLSLMTVLAAIRSTLPRFGLRGAVIAGLVVATWFELIYFAPKALTEVVAGNLLVLGVVLADIGRSTDSRPYAAAALLALASMLRIQLAVAALPCVLLLLHAKPRRQQVIALTVAAAVVLAIGLLDAITWSYPFESLIENIRVNVIVGKSAQYGIAPWYAYFEVYAHVWGIWGLVILTLAAIGGRARPLVAFAALAVLATHIPIGHKEYRFAYPAMALTILLASIGTAQVIEWVAARTSTRTARLATIAVLIVWMSASLRRANTYHESQTRLAITAGPSQSHWSLHRGGLLAMQELGEDRDVCGIGLIGITMFNTGGYTYLHRNIPVFEMFSRSEIAPTERYVNVFLIGRPVASTQAFHGYERESCIEEACIYRRPGMCETLAGYSYNAMLAAHGR